MPKKATIKDIARLAGVARSTVSRVINDHPDVDEDTRKRVLKVIEEQGYVPSITATGLAGGRSRLVGMIVPSYTWPIIGDLVRGITEILNQTSYELVVYTFNDDDLTRDRRDIINRLLATQLTAGFLAVFPSRLSAQLTQCYEQGLPVVIIDDQQSQITPWVRADNTTGAYSAVRHLIQLGHRRIAHIQGPHQYLASHDRRHGYLNALAEAGITHDPELILEGDFLPNSGYACAQRLFDLPAERRPTAIFAAADQMAYGVLRAAEERRVRVPEDVALVGYDDDTPSAFAHPTLTTVREPSFEIGQEGIKLLLDLLNRQEERASRPNHTSYANHVNLVGATAQTLDAFGRPNPAPLLILPTTLIVRASCGAALSGAPAAADAIPSPSATSLSSTPQ